MAFDLLLKYISLLGTAKLEAPTEPVSLTCHFVLRKLYTVPSIGASYQISINLGKRFKRIFFLIGQSKTRTAYGGHICCKIGTKYGHFVQNLPYIILYKVTIHCAF
jgi:hypothetical protein